MNLSPIYGRILTNQELEKLYGEEFTNLSEEAQELECQEYYFAKLIVLSYLERENSEDSHY